MKDLGSAKKILGMEIKRDRSQGKLWLLQMDYIERVLERFGMKEAKSVVAPMEFNLKLSLADAP
ncbi:Retrovirus-related Pol polyprotein from transposon TNT 1-94 [Vitis vinifera]|uniref:Retrovirus-related Pol polyprotein from transposon TNT 1-94 n=1 Tax=Vitis vinifera TaxID=29760 RepID=A0A438H7J6_VITVI|nr:Retrovirus-related Pol polyprotein from transposon TNT 1-94 [Vitis vinifera]